jgi:hypothetical protein
MKCNGVAVSGAWTNPLSAGGVIEIDINTVRIFANLPLSI